MLNKTRSDYPYQPWRTQNSQQSKKQQDQCQSTQHQVQKHSHLGYWIPRFVFCIDRYKTRRKSTLGKNPPKKIGDSERNKESIRDQSTAQELRKRNITDKSSYPRQQRHQTDCHGRSEHLMQNHSPNSPLASTKRSSGKPHFGHNVRTFD